LNKDYL